MKPSMDWQELVQNPDFSGYVADPGPLEENELEEWLEQAKAFARPAITGFKVGALAVGESGRIYLGANLEFTGAPQQASLHAEQSAVLNAWMHGESLIESIAVSEIPCGHCRQFLLELSNAAELRIRVKGQTKHLADLIPDAFSLKGTNCAGLLDSPPQALDQTGTVKDEAAQQAIDEACRSYSPYCGSPEAVIIETESRQRFAGRTAESSALNPGVPAVLTALNQWNLSARREESIRRGIHAMMKDARNHSLAFSECLIGGMCSEPVERVLLTR